MVVLPTGWVCERWESDMDCQWWYCLPVGFVLGGRVIWAVSGSIACQLGL